MYISPPPVTVTPPSPRHGCYVGGGNARRLPNGDLADLGAIQIGRATTSGLGPQVEGLGYPKP